MNLQVNLTQLGAWELTYLRKFTGSSTRPHLQPIELPYLTECRIFLIGATSLRAKPTWYRAGWLHQEIPNIYIDGAVIFEGLERIPSTSVDAASQLIPLNSVQLIIFPQLHHSYRLRFEPVPWLQEVTLAVWEYRGIESDSTEDLIHTMRSKLETIEFKINQL